MMIFPVYIGYDPAEAAAYAVCEYSIKRRTRNPVFFRQLALGTLWHAGFHTRTFHFEGKQRFDNIDGKPFSTEFSFTRFLVPALQLYDGWALYCDCDFLFLDDIKKLFDLADTKYAAMCVKHQHDPNEDMKMDGQVQTRYRRKNWSSLVLWNCSHPANRSLTPHAVNLKTGSWMHAFEWLKDEEIGSIPPLWNYLSGVNAPTTKRIQAVHYTLGGPWLEHCKSMPYAEAWELELASMTAHQQRRVA